MSGFDINRFIDLTERESNHLICSICKNIFNNAVRSECEHTFCKNCVQQWIESDHKDCPDCRIEFETRKRSNDTRNDNNLVIIRNYLFKRNLLINNMINEMQIKCNFQWNGCKQSIKLSQLSTHIIDCEHGFCDKCGFTLSDTEEHNCIQHLKNNRNEWKEKYENDHVQLINKNKLIDELKEEISKLKVINEQKLIELKARNEQQMKDINQLKANVSQLQNRLRVKENDNYYLKNELLLNKGRGETIFKNILEKVLDYSEPSQSVSRMKHSQTVQHYLTAFLSLAQQLYPHNRRIYFGNYYTSGPKVEIGRNGFTFKSVQKNDPIPKILDLSLPFKQIQEVMYYRETDFNAIVLKINRGTCDKFRQLLALGDSSSNSNVFDINSNVSKHRYITIRFVEEEENFECYLRCLSLCEPKLKIEEKSSEEIFGKN